MFYIKTCTVKGMIWLLAISIGFTLCGLLIGLGLVNKIENQNDGLFIIGLSAFTILSLLMALFTKRERNDLM